MNQDKFESIHRGFSAQAKKVYDALPISEPWSPSQIMQELHRKNSGMNDARVILGCINTMVDAGVVVESPKSKFQRVEVKSKAIKEPMKVAKQDTSAIDRLSVIAQKLRELAQDMESAALDLAEQVEKNEADTTKMRQLQALLKSLG